MLWRFVAPYRLQMVGAAIALVIAAGCFLVIGQGLKRVIDLGFMRGDALALNHALFALLGVIVVDGERDLRAFLPGVLAR
jgi:ATP-binding cassette subfamily B protein